ncbi:MAG: transporter associated domain-containing protein, partial [Thiopseudomonas sp.]
LQLQDHRPAESLSDFVTSAVGGEVVVGDHIEWQGLTWTVAEMDNGRISKVGLKFTEERG